MKKTTSQLVGDLQQWGRDKGLTGEFGTSDLATQHDKLMEEAKELGDEIHEQHQNPVAIMDESADCLVVLIQLLELQGISFDDALAWAHDKISKRTGTTVGGTFIKDHK